MNQISAQQAHEDYFGPASEPILLRDFLQDIVAFTPEIQMQQGLDSEQLASDCHVEDLKFSLNSSLSDPATYAFLTHSHEKSINSLGTNAAKKSLKRKKYDSLLQEVNHQSPSVIRLRAQLDSIRLKCWSYPSDSVAFVRPPKNADSNALTEVRTTISAIDNICSETVATSPSTPALIFVSVYSRLTWGNHLSRNSSHVLLSTHSLGDLYDTIPCSSNEMTCEDSIDVYDLRPGQGGCLICIEGVLYGDGQSDRDYSDKFLKHLETLPEEKRPNLKKGPRVHSQDLASLPLRTNHPYWLVHQGDCEHFLVIDHIRLMHSDDRRESYPLTIFTSLPVLDLCQACSRVPATLSVVGDVRLGQSPCKLCQTCWAEFGDSNDEGVKVIQLYRSQPS